MRTRQTLSAILKASFEGQAVQLSSEPRLREQDFGNFQATHSPSPAPLCHPPVTPALPSSSSTRRLQDPHSMDAAFAEREAFGRFYYRFQNGEAGTDVFDRVSSFLVYLFSTFGERGYFVSPAAQSNGRAPPRAVANYILVTHGLLMRIFCMCYLRWTVTEFEQVWNPSNGEIWVLQKVARKGTYELRGRWRASRRAEGRYVDLKFGADRAQPMPEHMKRPTPSRLVVNPGAPDAFAGDEFGHLRDLPGPRRWARGDWDSWIAEVW